MASMNSTSVMALLAALVFVAILLLLGGCYLLWTSAYGSHAKKLSLRLQSLSTAQLDQPALLKDHALSALPLLDRFLSRIQKALLLNAIIRQAGLSTKVSTLLLSCLAAGAAVLLVSLGTWPQEPLLDIAGSAACACLPLAHVLRLRRQRLATIERQLPEAIDLVVRALRAGHAFSAALQMVGEEMSEPIAGEFRTVHDEVNFGVALNQALMNLRERLPSTDLPYFIVAVLIQRDSGGNLTEVLTQLSRLMRERRALAGKIRVLSSEGRMSAMVLVAMPFVLGGGMTAANPEFMMPLFTDPVGITIVKYTVGLMFIGVLILRHIVRIRV